MKDFFTILDTDQTLDPDDWEQTKELAVQMVRDMFDYMKEIPTQSVWTPMPDHVKTAFLQPVPFLPQRTAEIYQEFKDLILPYNKGNAHPRFWGWAIGAGSPLGVMAELLATAMNPDICMGGHAPMYVEEQVIEWMKTIMDFPASAGGTLVSGASMANLTALIVARNNTGAGVIRENGMMQTQENKLVMYASAEVHSCVKKAAEAMGIGRNGVRLIKADESYRMKTDELLRQIKEDIEKGLQPFCVVATVGTVNTGAIDPLETIRSICDEYGLWMHIDGAFGALAKLVPQYHNVLHYLNAADSVAFDLHKWMSMPIGCGCVLVKDQEVYRRSFSLQSDYLKHFNSGVAAGPDPTFNYGLEMTKPFRALKVWMALKEHGIHKYANVIEKNIAQAFYLEHLIKETNELEVMAPVALNIVCFRFNPRGVEEPVLDQWNQAILLAVQESGCAVLSHTLLQGKFVLRVALLNHRTQKEDLNWLVGHIIFIAKTLLTC